MCKQPDIQQPSVTRLAAPTSEAARRESDFERILRRSRAGAAADVLTTPLGLPGQGAGA